MNDASEKNDSAHFWLVCMYVLAFFSNFISLETFLYFFHWWQRNFSTKWMIFPLKKIKVVYTSKRCFELEKWKKHNLRVPFWD